MLYTEEHVRGIGEGCVFYLNGTRYKMLKKTSTAIGAVRWYWFDVIGDWIGRRFGNN